MPQSRGFVYTAKTRPHHPDQNGLESVCQQPSASFHAEKKLGISGRAMREPKDFLIAAAGVVVGLERVITRGEEE